MRRKTMENAIAMLERPVPLTLASEERWRQFETRPNFLTVPVVTSLQARTDLSLGLLNPAGDKDSADEIGGTILEKMLLAAFDGTAADIPGRDALDLWVPDASVGWQVKVRLHGQSIVLKRIGRSEIKMTGRAFKKLAPEEIGRQLFDHLGRKQLEICDKHGITDSRILMLYRDKQRNKDGRQMILVEEPYYLYELDADQFIWQERSKSYAALDPETGKVVFEWFISDKATHFRYHPPAPDYGVLIDISDPLNPVDFNRTYNFAKTLKRQERRRLPKDEREFKEFARRSLIERFTALKRDNQALTTEVAGEMKDANARLDAVLDRARLEAVLDNKIDDLVTDLASWEPELGL